MARPCALILSITAFLAAGPTWADSFFALPMVQRADELLTRAAPTPVVERQDAIVRLVPIVFQYGSVEERSIPIPVSGQTHHTVTLAEYTMHVSKKLDLRGGAGLAEIIDAPAKFDMPRSGPAVGGGVNVELTQVKGFRVALDFSALHVRYGAIGMTDEMMLIELSAR